MLRFSLFESFIKFSKVFFNSKIKNILKMLLFFERAACIDISSPENTTGMDRLLNELKGFKKTPHTH